MTMSTAGSHGKLLIAIYSYFSETECEFKIIGTINLCIRFMDVVYRRARRG